MAGLPADLAASIFVVLHLPATAESSLPEILSRAGPFPATHPNDGELFKPRHVYVAKADHHMLVERGRVVVKKGPKENRFRPSIDALFRSAAYVYGRQVIGIVLSGMLDDGTSGLWSIKRMGGITMVQNPETAAFDSMPLNALRDVQIDHTLDAAGMGPLLAELIARPVAGKAAAKFKDAAKRMAIEIGIATSDNAFQRGIMDLGKLTPFTCPECHGVLVELKEGLGLRYRCHTGHAYSANALLGGVMEMVDEYNWQHVRALEEAVMLLRHAGKHLSANEPAIAKVYFEHAKEAERQAGVLQKATLSHQNFSGDRLRAEGNRAMQKPKRRA